MALPGEQLPENGRIRWQPPAAGPPAPGVAASSQAAPTMAAAAVPTINTQPQNHLSAPPSGFQDAQSGPSPSGYGRFADPVKPAGRGLHRTLPPFVHMGQPPPPAPTPSIPAAPAEQTAQQEEVMTLRAMVASLRDQVNQQHARFPAYHETPTPCTTDGWTFATDPSNPENDANMEPRT